jgi:hypothetical protein
MTDNTGKFWILGMTVGFWIGLLSGVGVANYNDNIRQAASKKQLIELGVGSYDSRAGAFQVKACPK